MNYYEDVFVVTAYTNRPEEGTNGITASGNPTVAGRTIAVDPAVIPLGTKVEINGNIYTAEDTGGAIDNKRIDIFMEDLDAALQFGKQSLNVKVYNGS
ncbi:MAG: 3D domain-containing protein [Bacillota bacterium]